MNLNIYYWCITWKLNRTEQLVKKKESYFLQSLGLTSTSFSTCKVVIAWGWYWCCCRGWRGNSLMLNDTGPHNSISSPVSYCIAHTPGKPFSSKNNKQELQSETQLKYINSARKLETNHQQQLRGNHHLVLELELELEHEQQRLHIISFCQTDNKQHI